MEKIEGIFCCSEKKDFEKNTEISLKPKIFLSKYFFGLDKFPFLILETSAHIRGDLLKSIPCVSV